MTIRYFDIAREAPAHDGEPSLDLSGATRWLTGEERKLELAAQGAAGRRHYISPAAAGELTRAFLGVVASQARTYFEEGMPRGYALPPTKPQYGLLPTYPHLGWCSFAAVRMQKKDGSPYIIRFHYANFNAEINTDPEGNLFKLSSPRRTEMYFGVAFSAREKGSSEMVIDRSVHHAGVSFITYDHRKALDNAIKLRTGVTPEEWRRMAARKAEEAKKAAA
jgi:hypothetical protein|nr:DUF6656 family protein [Neorhizobium tomejilense]